MSDTKINKNRFRGKKDQEIEDLAQAQKIKPHLRKYLINAQRQRAQEVATEKAKDDQKMLQSDEVIRQAGFLAMQAIFEKKLWEKEPPFLHWRWLKEGYATDDLAREMNSDIAGFTTYLVREFNNFLKLTAQGKGYPHPLQEQNLGFFWSKFNADLKLLIEAEFKRVEAGNDSVILGKANSEGKIEPYRKRLVS